ncbi:SMI1/KNR4 family protein [Microbacterium suaedae]|uniref:SMI1/KNR4 family protein n=1 Tax=Microbacterium suaedae TaxID=2067813 RepID=UPI0013A64617|nr:SMI1/KNR4 family protein [Microbacterium suaedae]
MPSSLMIGDDGGGTAILLNLADRCIYEVGMGAMDAESMELSADFLDEFLAIGTCLTE